MASLACLRYRCYDRAKQTWLAAKLFYYGQRYQHFGPITVTGTVVDCVHKNPDGDTCFDVIDLGGRWHCEVTPCSDPELVGRVLGIKGTGARVVVRGTKTFDPNHHIGPRKFVGGGNEVHPVLSIEVL